MLTNTKFTDVDKKIFSYSNYFKTFHAGNRSYVSVLNLSSIRHSEIQMTK